ncbi:MAG: hypothetical protein JWM52_189 [Candidatus Saccharibacteria bacterium]|nr:hypothetical protein [Candidatus Saccharibacteria bacterium]
MTIEKQTFPTESSNRSTEGESFDDIPLAGSTPREQARAERDARITDTTPNDTDDIVPIGAGIMRSLLSTAKEHPALTAATGLLAGGAADAFFGDPIGTAFENSTSTDKIVAVGYAYDTGKGLSSALDTSIEDIISHSGIDDRHSIFYDKEQILADIPDGSTNFKIKLVDEGRTNKIELILPNEYVHSITLNSGAEIVLNPGSDVVLKAPEGATIKGDIFTFKDDQGTWYAVSPDWLRDTFAGQMTDEQIASLKQDSDFRVWINKKDVSDVQN